MGFNSNILSLDIVWTKEHMFCNIKKTEQALRSLDKIKNIQRRIPKKVIKIKMATQMAHNFFYLTPHPNLVISPAITTFLLHLLIFVFIPLLFLLYTKILFLEVPVLDSVSSSYNVCLTDFVIHIRDFRKIATWLPDPYISISIFF